MHAPLLAAPDLPHGYCLLWQPGLIWLHAVSDTLIAAAYATIPVTLTYFIRKRRDLPFSWMFLCFGVFILACGLTHAFGVLNIWVPTWWLTGGVKAVTALASLPTAVLLGRLVPKALALPSASQLAEANAALAHQVAERERAEEALRRAHANLELEVERRTAELVKEQEFLHALFDSAESGIVACNSDGLITRFNTKAREFHVAAESPVPARLWAERFDLYRADGSARLPMQEIPLYRALNGERVHNAELLIAPPEAPPRHVLCSGRAMVAPDGVTLGAVVVMYDITERKAQEAALRLSESRYRQLTESLPQMVWTADRDGALEYVNQRWRDFTGHDLAHSRIEGWTGELHPDDRARAAARWTEALAQQQGCDMDVRFRRADGEHRWHLVRIVPIGDGAHNVVAWLGTCTDVHDQRESEAAVRQAQKLESIGVLAGGIAHDFNNLLTGILGNASLALRHTPAGGALRPLIDDVIRASERAADLTRQLLAYAGKGQFHVQRVDLSRTVSEIIPLIHASVPKKVAIELALLEPCPAVEADRTQMNQIVMNLVINAAEAIGEHTGTIRVRTSLETLDARAIQQRLPTYEPSPGQYVCLEVSDTGVGMDAETMTRIFDPFFTTKFMGRGLGLAALQGIVRGHRGAVEVRSAPNAGTTFRIFLPAAEQRTADATRPPSAARADGATVLVIDDAPDVRAVAKGMLEEEGCVVHLASTGLEGVERFARLARGVDVVLLDVAMPIMSGEETLTALRRIRADVPVVVMSGYGDLETMQRFEGARVTGFLQKPFTPEQLAAKVREALKADSD